jgi:superfamily II DNA or RNA helicase
LSATPFRGSDDEESLRLAKRFDQRWFPKDQAALYHRLRTQGVLSIVDHDPLESTASLTGDELEILENLGSNWEGFEFDRIIESFNQRLAADAARNELLLDRLQSAGEKSILFFGNSVEHSQEIFALLHLRGIRAAAISADTPAAARRQFLDQFQRGIIRVLCNHSVLATGFDAPRIDMILIARQVFSPVRYMQMVGRGLRGVANGGTERCRVVTVIDNLGRFQDKHPYHYCRRYFQDAGTF